MEQSTDLAVCAITYVISLRILQGTLPVIQLAWASHIHSRDHICLPLGVAKVEQVMGRLYMLLKTLYSEDARYGLIYDLGSAGDRGASLDPQP